MTFLKRALFWAVAAYGFTFQVMAQNSLEKPLGDSAFVSLITVSPGAEVYAHYGHTAIRVCDPGNRFDLVFNYGLFDFNSPNFLGRFITGQTDYVCGAFPYSDFLLEYQMENRAVTEQIINLTKVEKETIWQALVQNIQPENRTYRYNFFFNNCATKPRDIIVNNLTGKVDYRWNGLYKSLRAEVHHYTRQHAWTQFGIDFLIAAQADDSATLKTQQFAPELLMQSFDKAVILDDSGQVRPLVLKTRQPVTIDPGLVEKGRSLPAPTLVMWVLFIALAISTFFEMQKGKAGHLLTAILYALLGITGSIIAFLVFFSEHPTTHVNYLLLWQNPLHLIFAIGMIFAAFRKKWGNLYLSANFILQLFALIGTTFLPQQLHPAMYPLLLSLLLRSAQGSWFYLKQVRK
jgi:hypothetical protein